MSISCPNKRLKVWRDLVKNVGENKAYVLWAEYDGNVPDNYYKELPENILKTGLKATNILMSEKAIQIFEKGKKANWDLNKILTELQVPKDQKQLILDLGISDREKIALELASKYSYAVEINISTELIKNNNPTFAESQGFDFGTDEKALTEFQWKEYQFRTERITKEEYDEYLQNLDEKYKIKDLYVNTSYYNNLSVPGGINYTEQEISTPLITPSIKGHAQFATDNGIGWFRSDIQAVELSAQNAATNNKGNLTPFDNDYGKVPTKTRRILEVQSDLFQKGRDNKFLDKNAVEIDKRGEDFGDLKPPTPNTVKSINSNKNQFLQLLNKDNNWVTFFIKSIIQDSTKKGYDKVLFPSGNTASKVEGHTTLEEFKKQKEDRLNGLLSAKIVEKEFESYDENTGETEILPFRVEYNENGKQYSLPYKTKEDAQKNIDSYKIEISQLKQELERVEGPEGFAALKPIYNFYENTVTNILNKTYGKDNVKVITDEYGNTWNEITLEETRDNSTIFMKKVDFNDLIGSKKNEVVSENNEIVNEVEDFSKENSKVLFNDKSKVTVDEVLDNIINNFNDLSPIGKELVTKAKNLKNKTGANVKFVKESVLETENTVMQIDAKTNTIEISKERLAKVNSKIAIESFLHELGHAQSLQALINPVTFEEKQFAELINKMFKWYGDLSNGSKSYGFTNEAEFVSELYTNKAFQDEIRALDVEENTSYWKQFIDAVRRLFGLAKSKQSDLLIEQIITFVESDRTNYTGIGNRRVVFAKRIEDDSQYSSLESKLDNFNVAAKKAMITIQEKTVRSNRKKATEAKEDRIRENKELLDTLDKYSKAQKWKAVIGYTQSFNNTINHVEKLLNELLSTKNIYEDKLDLTIKRYKDYLSAYDLLPQIKELMSQADLKLFELTDEEKEDYQQLKDFLIKAKEKHDAIESKFLAISKAQVMQDFSNPLYNTEVETKQREFLLREYNSLSDKGGLTADQYVSKMLTTRDKNDYEADLKSSAEKILNDPSQDISLFSTKAEDNLNTKSKLIQVVNQMLVESFDKVKSLTVDKVHKMAKTFEKFIKEKGNVKLSELNKNLIEKDSEGNIYLKGKYKLAFKEAFDSELRPVLKARQEYIEESIMLGLDEKDYLASKKFKEFNKQISSWYKTHTGKNSDNKTVPKAKYLNKPLTGTEKEILDSYIKINDNNDDIEGFQSLVTDIHGARFHKLPSQSKSDLERALELDIKGITKDKWNDLTKVRTDDIGLQTGNENKNSQGEIINHVKTHYRGKIDPNEQSLDLETMFRNEYWNGQNYKEKSRLEPKLLMIADIAKEKEFYTGKNKDVVPGLSNTYNRLVGMMERNVYDIMSKHGGNWGQVDINKVTNALNGYAAGLAMTLNRAASTTNVIGGLTDIFIEAVGGHRFNVATFAKAEAKYTKEVLNGNLLKDTYSSVKMSYFNQLLDMFDVMGGLGQNEQEALRNNIARKFGTTRSSNILNDMGEHAMHSILTQSLLDGIKAMDGNNNYLDKDGNITTEAKTASLVDMLYFDSEGILKMNPKVAYSNANLTVKYNEGGKSQINALIKHKVMDLFGVYDIKYQSEFSKTVAGKWVMLFKKFFLSKAAYRYTGFTTSYKKKENLTEDDRFYNSAEKEYIEGTYTTFVRFLRETGIPNLQMLQTMYMNWKNLSEYEKSNVKKATMEIMLTTVILPSLGLLMAGMDDDDDDNNLLWFFIYVNRRLTRELAQFRNPIEAAKMIQNPVAGIRFIQNGLNFMYDVITPVNFVPGKNESVFGWADENTKGENKMWNHATKLVPILPQLGVDYKQRHSLEFK